MTTLAQKRTIWDALIFEPIELIISQPHQALISSASVFLVAAEAGILIDPPYNVLLAIGAEWAYLKGLSSGQQVRTGWATALNWSAVLLVVLYGSLWGLRKFGAIPVAPPIWGAILLTLIHILCIGAVTICSAMVHSAMLAEQKHERERKQAAEEARARRLQDQQDAIERDQARARVELEIDLAKRRADLELWQAGQQAKQVLKSQSNATKKSGTVPETKGKTAFCVLGNHEVAWSTPSEAGTIKRWGCAECRARQQ
jgi:hypothetical protein